jgi:uncharacterized cupin superfamily protein
MAVKQLLGQEPAVTHALENRMPIQQKQKWLPNKKACEQVNQKRQPTKQQQRSRWAKQAAPDGEVKMAVWKLLNGAVMMTPKNGIEMGSS